MEQPEYAPELQPLAAVVGAPPADLTAMLDHVDGAMASIVILYAVAGMMASDTAIAEEIAPHLSPEGLEAVLSTPASAPPAP
ncbi:lipase family protein [Corynebacterium aquatimens]|uniref:lipase family protein n=1 Tax=Corynebacterium aquatimens TaxID=1190508 RepID=UPI0025405072|nr:lipase family protein [Corynebacterium aquatimens]